MITYIGSLAIAVFFFSLIQKAVVEIKGVVSDDEYENEHDFFKKFLYAFSGLGSIFVAIPFGILLLVDTEFLVSLESVFSPFGISPIIIICVFFIFLVFVLAFKFAEEDLNKAMAWEIFCCSIFISLWIFTTHFGFLSYFVCGISLITAHFLALPVSKTVVKKLLRIRPRSNQVEV
jgi:hypothetical protein